MKKILVAAISIVLLASCTKDDVESHSIQSINEYSVEQKTDLISSYAQMLAASMGNPEIRNVIKSEAQLKFDGDYDILVNTLHSVELKEHNVTIKKMLANSCVETRANEGGFSGDLDTLIEEIQSQFPNLQVSVPVHCDEWDTENYIPLVAFLPYDYDDQVATEIEAFDTNGNSYMLSLDEDPEQPVIVVSISERVDRDGSFKGGNASYINFEDVDVVTTRTAPTTPSDINLFHAGAETLELEWTDTSNETGYVVYRKTESVNTYSVIANLPANQNYYIDTNVVAGVKYSYKVRAINIDGESGYSAAITSFASDRNDGESLKIKRMYFTNSALKAVEKWASGAPEIRLRVVCGDSNSATTVFTSGLLEPAKRGDINGSWWNKSVDITNWRTNAIGTVLTFDWREEDWDDDVTFTIQASFEVKLGDWTIKAGGSVQFSGDEGGDIIGNKLVHYWDESNKTYDISGFKWEFE